MTKMKPALGGGKLAAGVESLMVDSSCKGEAPPSNRDDAHESHDSAALHSENGWESAALNTLDASAAVGVRAMPEAKNERFNIGIGDSNGDDGSDAFNGGEAAAGSNDISVGNGSGEAARFKRFLSVTVVVGTHSAIGGGIRFKLSSLESG